MIISLAARKYAPWGLFTDNDPPRPVLWLTEKDPWIEVDEESLSMLQLDTVQKARAAGIIQVEGYQPISEEGSASSYTKIFNPAEEVQATLQREETPLSRAYEFPQQLPSSPLPGRFQAIGTPVLDLYAEARKILDKKVVDVLGALEEKKNEGATLAFFQACREEESKGKARKRVLKFLVTAIEECLAKVSVDRGSRARFTGASSLESQYASVIVEEEV